MTRRLGISFGRLITILATLLVASAPLRAQTPAEPKLRLAVIDLTTGEGVSPDEGQMLTMFIRDAIAVWPGRS